LSPEEETAQQLLESCVREGFLTYEDIDTNFVIFTVLEKKFGITLSQYGIQHGAGWANKELVSIETLRVRWSEMRNQPKHAFEKQYKKPESKDS